jgi:hypothetical protein
MSEAPEDICRVSDDVLGFRDEVGKQREEERSLLSKLSQPTPHAKRGDAIVILLLAVSVVLMLLVPIAILLWLVVGILLYSYNFIILLLPTTMERNRPEETQALRRMGIKGAWPAITLLLKKKFLAIEIGITLYLGGMVPLSVSFTIILGLGILMTAYYALVAGGLQLSFAFLVVVQLVFIIGFYLFVVLLAPQEQGVTRLARTFKRRIEAAREGEGRSPWRVYLIVAVVIIVAIVLVFGAVLLPGITLVAIMVQVDDWGWGSIAILIFVAWVQLVVMRHFQSESSRKIVVIILEERIRRMKEEVLDPLETWTDGGLCLDRDGFHEAFKTLKKNFYSMAVYDIIRLDLFGLSPVYLVGPRLRYVLNDKVLECF